MPQRPGDLLVGLDLGGTNIKGGLVFVDGQLLRSGSMPLPREHAERTPEAVANLLTSLGQELLDLEGLAWSDVSAVGVASPGQVIRDTGTVVAASSFPGWKDVPLAELIYEHTQRPVALCNDANAAAAAEAWTGFGKGQPGASIVVLTLGTGVGMGFVQGGRVMPGARGLVEGGHMIVDPAPGARPCPCGQTGCLEAYASASAVTAMTAELLAEGTPHSPPRSTGGSGHTTHADAASGPSCPSPAAPVAAAAAADAPAASGGGSTRAARGGGGEGAEIGLDRGAGAPVSGGAGVAGGGQAAVGAVAEEQSVPSGEPSRDPSEAPVKELVNFFAAQIESLVSSPPPGGGGGGGSCSGGHGAIVTDSSAGFPAGDCPFQRPSPGGLSQTAEGIRRGLVLDEVGEGGTGAGEEEGGGGGVHTATGGTLVLQPPPGGGERGGDGGGGGRTQGVGAGGHDSLGHRRGGVSGLGEGGAFSARDVFEAAAQGDPLAAEVAGLTSRFLGLACVNICRLLDPDAILLAGGMAKAQGLLPAVQSEFASRGWTVLPHECRIELATAGNDAGVIGAAAAAAWELSQSLAAGGGTAATAAAHVAQMVPAGPGSGTKAATPRQDANGAAVATAAAGSTSASASASAPASAATAAAAATSHDGSYSAGEGKSAPPEGNKGVGAGVGLGAARAHARRAGEGGVPPAAKARARAPRSSGGRDRGGGGGSGRGDSGGNGSWLVLGCAFAGWALCAVMLARGGRR